jgi:hypothetical protein
MTDLWSYRDSARLRTTDLVGFQVVATGGAIGKGEAVCRPHRLQDGRVLALRFCSRSSRRPARHRLTVSSGRLQAHERRLQAQGDGRRLPGDRC